MVTSNKSVPSVPLSDNVCGGIQAIWRKKTFLYISAQKVTSNKSVPLVPLSDNGY